MRSEVASAQTIAARVSALFAKKFHVEVPALGTDLFDLGILDSLRFVELLAALEEAFDLHVSVEELEIDDFRTVARIAEFVAGKQLSLRE